MNFHIPASKFGLTEPRPSKSLSFQRIEHDDEPENFSLGCKDKSTRRPPDIQHHANIVNERQNHTACLLWSRLLWLLTLLMVCIVSFIMGRKSVSGVTITVLHRRQAAAKDVANAGCGKAGIGEAEYNLGLHIGAVFIILAVSSLACAFPVLAIRFPSLRLPKGVIFTIRHFGTGVLLGTAFCHLFPTAFISLSNPCLSDFWTDKYQATPGAIALAGVFFVTTAEMIFSPFRLLHKDVFSSPNETNQFDQTRALGQVTGRASSIGRSLLAAGQDHPQHQLAKELELTPDQIRKKALMQCLLLEMGILFHSVFIGMALSVTPGPDFIVLLIAIVFHQTCEGLALGARIGTIQWRKSSLHPWLMALAYGCTTPIGQAIGLATQSLYDPDSEVGLLVVGIFNAISSGLLVYASLVELLAEDFLSDESWRTLRGDKRLIGFGLVLLGAFCMSLIGAWA